MAVELGQSGTNPSLGSAWEDELRQDIQFFFEMEILSINDRLQSKLKDIFRKVDAANARAQVGSHRISIGSSRKLQANFARPLETVAEQPEREEAHSFLRLRKRKICRSVYGHAFGDHGHTFGDHHDPKLSYERSHSNRRRPPMVRSRSAMASAMGSTDSQTSVFDWIASGSQSSLDSELTVTQEQERTQEEEAQQDAFTGSLPSDGHDDDDNGTAQASQMLLQPNKFGSRSSIRDRGIFESILRSPRFELIIAFLVFLNSAVLGLEADYCARRHTMVLPGYFVVVDRIFCGIFLLEQVVKYAVMGTNMFYVSDGSVNTLSYLAILDLGLVILQVCDEIMVTVSGIWTLQFSQEWRILRLIRIIRLTRGFKVFSPLRTMLVSIFDSIRYFLWAMVLLMLLTYMFSVFLTQVVTETKGDEDDLYELLHFFGSMDKSFLTLYEVISDGIHWRDVVNPLIVCCHPLVTVVFICYTSFVIFVLMNIITSSFIEGALRTGEEDKKSELIRQMSALILATDEDCSGTISWDEFQAHLTDPQMQVLLKAIDFDQEEARALFHLLDTENNGEIGVHDFMSGCIRLQGYAKAVEMAALMSEFHRFQEQWRDSTKRIETMLRDWTRGTS